jgi:hypothetical protein
LGLEPYNGQKDGAGGDHAYRHRREHLQEMPPESWQVSPVMDLRRVTKAYEV